jgi:hypothetical protein
MTKFLDKKSTRSRSLFESMADTSRSSRERYGLRGLWRFICLFEIGPVSLPSANGFPALVSSTVYIRGRRSIRAPQVLAPASRRAAFSEGVKR